MVAKNRVPKDNEIHLTRVYDAPVKLVWDAWTDPKRVAQWWGPRGFTLTTHSKDLRPGGRWHYTMHGPDGTDYENTTKYLEVEKHARLIYDHGGHADRPPLFRVTVLFEEVKGRTKMDMTMALATAEGATETKKFIKKAGGESTWDRLAEFLAQESKQEDIFVINRSFNAPVETLYKMWTDPAHTAQWTPPTGFTMKYLKADIKAGSTAFYEMSNGQGITMWGKAHYLELKPPHHIRYTQEFSDRDGNISRHPMAPLWPERMLTTITLEAESPTQTRVTIRWEVYGQATTAERAEFHKAKGGMTQGWTGSFDKLEAYLAK